jgi:hypothetical protein
LAAAVWLATAGPVTQRLPLAAAPDSSVKSKHSNRDLFPFMKIIKQVSCQCAETMFVFGIMVCMTAGAGVFEAVVGHRP